MGMASNPCDGGSAAEQFVRLIADRIPGTRLNAAHQRGHIIITGPCGLMHLMTDKQAIALRDWLAGEVIDFDPNADPTAAVKPE